MTHFADQLTEMTRMSGPLCVGIDPHPGRIPALFGGDTPAGLEAWGKAIVSRAVGRVAVVKPQAGLFERHGPEGVSALQAVTAHARSLGLLVIMDAKRGDIGSTAEGYAAAYLAPGAPFEADCLTVNPYMGLDTLEPYFKQAESHGKGLAVLARTSNPGSADFQALEVDGTPLWSRVTQRLAALAPRLHGKSGWSSLMLVAGATGPDEARAMRKLASSCLFLVPGYGAQGAGAAEALTGFAPNSSGRLEGGVVNASRSVTFPEAAQSAESASDWDRAIIAAIDAAQADLKSAAGAS